MIIIFLIMRWNWEGTRIRLGNEGKKSENENAKTWLDEENKIKNTIKT